MQMLVQGRIQPRQRGMFRMGAEGGFGRPPNTAAGLTGPGPLIVWSGYPQEADCSLKQGKTRPRSAVRQVLKCAFRAIAIDTESGDGT